MESLILVANFSGNIRRETSGGRKFIVAPLTMIVPGVLNGSQGPLYYPEDEVVASTPYWEGVILTDDHLPAGANGKRISVQQQYALGYVQNPVIKNNRLMAEGWFDIDRTRRLNPKILTALEQGYKIELSTGLNVDFDNTSGVHNGRQYSQVVRKYRPDHLAVLIGKRGACSLNDGCGINNEGNMLDQDELDTEDFDLDIEQDEDVDNEDVDNEWSDHSREVAAQVRAEKASRKATKASDVAEKEGFSPQAWKAHSQAEYSHSMAAIAHRKAGNDDDAVEHERTASVHYKFVQRYGPNHVRNEEVANAFAVAGKLNISDKAHVAGAVAALGKGFRGNKVKLSPANRAIAIKKVRTAWLKFNPDKTKADLPPVLNEGTLPPDSSGKVMMKKKKTKKKVMPSDCSDKSVTNKTNNKENKMALTDAQKNELIDNVINNCACYTEDDREDLSGLDDRMLSSIANGVEAEKKDKKAKELVANAEATKETVKPIDIKSLPVEVQRVLNYGAAAIQRDKEVLIDKLVANQATDDAKKARKEVLSKLTLEELQDRVSDLPAEKVDNSTFDFNRLVGNFSGASAGGYKVANEAGPAGGQLGSPEINWSKN